jgi:two-component system, sensor histidine kinase
MDGERPRVARQVLVLDDHPQSRVALCVGLRRRGYIAKPVGSASAAVEALHSFGSDVVVMEWYLRSATGVGLAARLRRVATALGRSITIVAVSSQPMPDEFLKREVVDGYLEKPVSLDDLVKLIRS